jgi:hypothetical protein
MRKFFSMRMILLALLLAVIPASSYAGVLISVGFAPPVLPVYVQPPCPEPGWMWTPGYWAYGPDGYYWVPGTWVPAPYVGALWTPGYWGWSAGLYVWNPGYWGPTVGYYGGVNYGFGYMGIGFVGGEWRGGVFAYNRAVMHVGDGPGWGGNRVYEDRTVITSHTVVNNHVAFSGGPGGVNHPPTPAENAAMHQQHIAATSAQTQHETTAMHDTNSYASHNGGHPTNAAVARPMGAGPSTGNRQAGGAPAHGAANPAPQSHPAPAPQSHPAPAPQSRPAPAPQSRPAPAPQSRPAPAPQSHPAPKPEGHGR